MRIVITGAAGHIGSLVTAHLAHSTEHELVLIDCQHDGESAIQTADLARHDTAWDGLFSGADVVIHLAGDPRPEAPWSALEINNVQATLNVFQAAADHNVGRVIFASTLRTMEGYRYHATPISADLTPRPATFYAISKLMGELIGRQFAEQQGMSVICLRLGAVQSGPETPSRNWTVWTRARWLNKADLCQVFEKAILADAVSFAALPVTSDNEAKVWDLTKTCAVLGYEPSRGTGAEPANALHSIRAGFGWLHRRYLDPLWRGYWD